MNPTVEAAWITAGLGALGIAGTALTAIFTARSSAKSAAAAASAASASAAAALDAAHDAWVRDKRADLYRTLMTLLARHDTARVDVLKLARENSGESANKLAERVDQILAEMARDPQGIDPDTFVAGIMAYGHSALIQALQDSNAAIREFGDALIDWVDARGWDGRSAGRSPAEIAQALDRLTMAAAASSAADGALEAALRTDLLRRPSDRTDSDD
jgi:hypothetical protein